MEIIRGGVDVASGPSDRFVGVVLIQPIVHLLDARTKALSMEFSPASRSAWHAHPGGETVLITRGIGVCQRRGEPIEVLRVGDQAIFRPGEEHWHGALPTRDVVQTSIAGCDEENKDTCWMEHVSDDEYQLTAELDGS